MCLECSNSQILTTRDTQKKKSCHASPTEHKSTKRSTTLAINSRDQMAQSWRLSKYKLVGVDTRRSQPSLNSSSLCLRQPSSSANSDFINSRSPPKSKCINSTDSLDRSGEICRTSSKGAGQKLRLKSALKFISTRIQLVK